MVHMSLEVPEDLADRIGPLRPWLPTVLSLSLIGFRTQAAAAATELLEFLATGPSPEAILAYQASDESQARLRRLLALNEAGLLGESEQRELDELERIEHVVILLKAEVASPRPR